MRCFKYLIALLGYLAILTPAGDVALAHEVSAFDEVHQEESSQSWSRKWANGLRRQCTSDEARLRYGLKHESSSHGGVVADPKQLVVLIHGYNSNIQATEALLRPARRAGLRCAGFAYPNDQSLDDSAELLSQELKRFARQEPSCRVSLVTHSMGGLVARACIEDRRLDPGNVDQLIMVAPPTHGSILAQYAVATDLWEHWINRRSGSPWRRAKDSVVDGLGEASADLTPGSRFLVELNARRRNPSVCYSLVLGSGAPISDERLTWVRTRAKKALETCRAEKSAARLDRCLADLEQVVTGKGDGVVALRRAKLAGVTDVTVLDFGHLEVASESKTRAAQQAQQVVLNRLLKKSSPKPKQRKRIHLISHQAG